MIISNCEMAYSFMYDCVIKMQLVRLIISPVADWFISMTLHLQACVMINTVGLPIASFRGHLIAFYLHHDLFSKKYIDCRAFN